MPLSSVWEGTGTDPGDGNRKAVPHTPIKSNLINWILDQIVNNDLPFLRKYAETSVTTVTSNYSITTDNNEIVLADSSSGNITITLPDPSTRSGRVYTIKKISSANTVTISPYATETIDGASSKTLTSNLDMFILTTDGNNWYTVNKSFEHKKSTYDSLNINADKVDGIDLPNTTSTVLTDHNKALHDALGIDADTVDGIDLPNTIANVLTDHNKAAHDALGIDADTVDGMDVTGIPHLYLDVSGNRPTAGTAGRVFFETDTKRIYYDDGSAWRTIGTINWGDITGKPSTYPPSAHASSHGSGGSDEVSLDASQITTGTFSTARIPNLDASKITSGRFGLARLPTNATANVFLAIRTENADPEWTTLTASDIPNLDASKITTGRFSTARMPTSSTANTFLVVRTANSSPVYDTLTTDDIPSLTRSKISDFWSTSFWPNIPDKPFSTLGSEFTVSGGELQIQSVSSSKVTVNSDMVPSSDNSYDLGSASNRFALAYIVNIYAGDIHLENSWTITEGDKVGIDSPIALVSPSGEVYEFELRKVKGV